MNHAAKEYVHGDVFMNTVEGSFSIFKRGKRGMRGVYQHCGQQHLHRYLAEFDFRYSNRAKLGVTDPMRCDAALKGIVGKRLTYRRIDGLAKAQGRSHWSKPLALALPATQTHTAKNWIRSTA